MATYILLLTLTEKGREKALQDPRTVLRAQEGITISGIQVLGLYHLVNIAEADDNEAVAQFSLELGVRAGAHITTLPAVPIGRLPPAEEEDLPGFERETSLPFPAEKSGN